MQMSYYDDAIIDVRPEVHVRRSRDALDRIKTFRHYVDLNGMCDVGAGDGSFVAALKEQGFSDCFGVERNLHAQKIASLKGIDIIHGHAHDLPELCHGRTVSTVCFFHLLEHIPDPLGALQAACAVLPSGGSVVIETYNIGSRSVLKLQNSISYYHHFYFDDHTLPMLLCEAGFVPGKQGRSHFDRHRIGIAESLRRLGVMRRKDIPTKVSPKRSEVSQEVILQELEAYLDAPARPPRFPKAFIDRILSRIASLTGHTDYAWIVGKKP